MMDFQRTTPTVDALRKISDSDTCYDFIHVVLCMLCCCAHQVDMLYEIVTSHHQFITYAYEVIEHGLPRGLRTGNAPHPFSSSTPVSL